MTEEHRPSRSRPATIARTGGEIGAPDGSERGEQRVLRRRVQRVAGTGAER